MHDLMSIDDGLRGSEIALAQRQVLVLDYDAGAGDLTPDVLGIIGAAPVHILVEGAGVAHAVLGAHR
jgi:hypothetical protein